MYSFEGLVVLKNHAVTALLSVEFGSAQSISCCHTTLPDTTYPLRRPGHLFGSSDDANRSPLNIARMPRVSSFASAQLN